MTIHELNQLRYLDKEIQLLRERIAELRAEAERVTPSVTTYINDKKETCVLPKTGGAGLHRDKMADMVAAIIEEERQLEELCERRRQEKAKLMQFINDIPDSLTRQIFLLRFVDGKSWNAVAVKIGGGNTGESIIMRVKRYLKSC